MHSLQKYLVDAREFNTPSYRALVLGNPSADMDSVVGAIALSWFYGEGKPLKYTPVINCLRSEIKLRIEIMEHLSKLGMNENFVNENILFIDDLLKTEDATSNVESVGLVDFNELNKELESKLMSKVHYIIDHHVDNNKYLETVKEKEVKHIGSAATLVA
jgi:inorganic pyrophosphatase/exopolyphosphatase